MKSSKYFGLNSNFIKLFSERAEILDITKFESTYSYKWLVFLKLLNNLVPLNKSINDRYLLNIFFLDLIVSYRGWRHSRGLPVRGQRTWTNAWTTYRSNLTLREHKIVIAKKLYGSLPLDNLSTAYLAEQTNLLWKLQWENEWKEARKRRLISIKSNTRVTTVDLNAMSKGIVNSVSTKKSKKQKKVTFNKNLFTLGFDTGFVKALIKANYIDTNIKKKNSKQSKVNLIIGSSSSTTFKKK